MRSGRVQSAASGCLPPGGDKRAGALFRRDAAAVAVPAPTFSSSPTARSAADSRERKMRSASGKVAPTPPAPLALCPSNSSHSTWGDTGRLGGVVTAPFLFASVDSYSAGLFRRVGAIGRVLRAGVSLPRIAAVGRGGVAEPILLRSFGGSVPPPSRLFGCPFGGGTLRLVTPLTHPLPQGA